MANPNQMADSPDYSTRAFAQIDTSVASVLLPALDRMLVRWGGERMTLPARAVSLVPLPFVGLSFLRAPSHGGSNHVARLRALRPSWRYSRLRVKPHQ